ncbi:hypothetical protein CLV63_112171 [Murinocardiopsis flavida]|uniref:DUF2812 domain-containing protein n=1 Tax=Murinocardiopsis flavida TaxID=645275 RepID=A0A2P8DGE1_9ACTN|nr:hypothetical protein [Murinocardiopsis flavida]PSK96287.1 hypothetical protein CLV63_112171 [Murinocardiopsis flavida]
MIGYFDDLAARLAAKGLPPDRVEATVEDLAAYAAEAEADPEAEFGPAASFADQLAADEGPAAPDPGVETWRWTADIYADERLLNRFGDEGWEVDKVDALGGFVSRRDPELLQRWEYRREMVSVHGHGYLDRRLAPDGWELCGTWVIWAWYKRPKAASVGPAAALDAPPPPPGRRNFLSRRFLLLVAVLVLAVGAVGTVRAVQSCDPADALGFITGIAVGGGLPLAVIALVAFWRDRRAR